jgi:hypothetical protein
MLLMAANLGDLPFRPLQPPFAAEGGVSGQAFYAWLSGISDPAFAARFNGLSRDPRDANLAL